MAIEIKIIQKDIFNVIISAVNKSIDLVRPTYGPASNKVIIDKNIYRMVVDDGCQIMRDIELSDPAENAVLKLIREVSGKTNDKVGDGTTSSLIILQAILNEVARKSKFDGRKIEKELKLALGEVKAQLYKKAKQIKTKEDIKKVARISFDDEDISEMIARLYFQLGKDGLITIDKSPTAQTTIEMSNGIKLESGYISPYMIINPERMESVIEKPSILLTDYRLTEANDILPIMNKMAEANKRELVIIAENVEQNALATAIVNRMQGKFLIVAIALPTGALDGSRENRKVLLEDLAIMTGAKVFTESKGNRLEEANLEDLGKAEKFICRKSESLIVSPKGSKGEIVKSIMSLKSAIENATSEKDKNELKKRLALFTNSLAVIRVGALTENEQKALKYKVEDSVNAVKSALKSGVVCGAGISLASLKTSSQILNESLKYPYRQLMENVGMPEENLDENHVLNVVTGERGKFMDVGVVDPVGVLIAGVESAISIAGILLTSSGIICEHAKVENKE